MRSDKTLPQYIVDKNYTVCIPNRDDWDCQYTSLPDDIVCFTNGSRHRGLGQSGASVYNQTTKKEYVFPLGKYSTVFQAEVYAILACVDSLQIEYEASIAICFDSQAALKALNSAKTTSNIVAKIIKALECLSLFNGATLTWVPGHSNVAGNETPDILAKQAACLDFIGFEPTIGIARTTVHTEARSWVDNDHHKFWQAAAAGYKAKMLLCGPDKQLSRFTLGLKKKQLRLLVGLLTGHIALNRHLTVMKIQTDAQCHLVEKMRKPPTTFWGNVMPTCWLDIPSWVHTLWSPRSQVR